MVFFIINYPEPLTRNPLNLPPPSEVYDEAEDMEREAAADGDHPFVVDRSLLKTVVGGAVKGEVGEVRFLSSGELILVLVECWG